MGASAGPEPTTLRCIGLSGPDGAGKSSLAAQLLALIRARGVTAQAVYLYGCAFCRRWNLAPMATRGGRPEGLVACAIWTLHGFVDMADLWVRLEVARLALATSRSGRRSGKQPVLITDRSPLDGLVKFLPRRGSLIERLYHGAAARYEAIAVLDAPADVLVLRDREHSLGYLTTRRSEFRERGCELPNVVRFDTGDASPRELAAAVVDQLFPPHAGSHVEAVAVHAQPVPGAVIRRSAGWLTVSAAIVGAANFAYTLILSWTLHRNQYAVFLSAQALVLICAMIAAAGLPWALSRRLARHAQDAVRAGAISFTTGVSVLLGSTAAMAVAVVAGTFARQPVVAAAALAAFMVFLSNPVIGYLQGNERFRLIFLLNVTDVTVRVAVGTALAVVLGLGATGALAGFSAGSAVVLLSAGWPLAKQALRFRPKVLWQPEMWRQVIGIASVQAGVGCLVNLDQVLAAVPTLGGGGRFATYQLAGVVGRIPFFISSGLCIAAFPRLARLGTLTEERPSLRDTLLRTLLPVSVAVGTVPSALVSLAVPPRYALDVGVLLPYTAAAGLIGGFINLGSMYFQAQAAFRRCVVVLSAGIAVTAAAIVIGMHVGPMGVAVAKLAALSFALGLLVAASPWLRTNVRSLFSSLTLVVAASAPLLLLSPWPGMWLPYVTGLGLFTFWYAFLHRSAGPGTPGHAGFGAPAGMAVQR